MLLLSAPERTEFEVNHVAPAACDRVAASAPCQLFRGVADWPLVNDLFAVRSLQIMAIDGIAAWLGQGGRRRQDGQLGFGPLSSTALATLQDLEALFGGFRWTDEAGQSWAVRLAGTDGDGDRLACAVTCAGKARILDAAFRRRIMSQVDGQLAACAQPARSWDDADRDRYRWLARRRYRLHLAQGAERILRYLDEQVRAIGSDDLCVSTEEIAEAVRASQEPHTGPSLAAMLHATMDFTVAQLRLGNLGWDPRIVGRSAPVTAVEQHGDHAWHVHTTPLLAILITTFGGSR